MSRKIFKETIIIEEEVFKKMAFIAEFYGQSLNKQIEHIIKNRIDEYEKENGAIIPETFD